MRASPDPIGPANDAAIAEAFLQPNRNIFA
jgi:hypothetical protein